jgi:hypothetical protein
MVHTCPLVHTHSRAPCVLRLRPQHPRPASLLHPHAPRHAATLLFSTQVTHSPPQRGDGAGGASRTSQINVVDVSRISHGSTLPVYLGL